VRTHPACRAVALSAVWNYAARRVGGQAQNDIAVALARSTHGPETGDDGVVEPNQSAALIVCLVLEADIAERERCGYRVERGFADGDADDGVTLCRGVTVVVSIPSLRGRR
jgi:hypothetical protein